MDSRIRHQYTHSQKSFPNAECINGIKGRYAMTWNKSSYLLMCLGILVRWTEPRLHSSWQDVKMVHFLCVFQKMSLEWASTLSPSYTTTHVTSAFNGVRIPASTSVRLIDSNLLRWFSHFWLFMHKLPHTPRTWRGHDAYSITSPRRAIYLNLACYCKRALVFLRCMPKSFF